VTAPQNRRPGQQPGAGDGMRRPRREPLFPLEPDDIAPSARRGPPAPLRELVSDIDEVMPSRAAPRYEPPREAAPQRRPATGPTRPQQVAHGSQDEAQPLRREEPRAQRLAAAAPRPVATEARQGRTRQELRPAPLGDPLDEMVRPVAEAHARYHEIDAEMARLSYAAARPRMGRPLPPPPPLPGLSLNNGFVMVVVAIASLIVLMTMGAGGERVRSRWNLLGGDNTAAAGPAFLAAAAGRPAGDYALQGPPSLTPQQIDRILESYGSPAAGTGEDWYNLGLQYGIDPAFAVAFFIHESSAGSNPAWAGIKPGGLTTHNVGNIICAGYPTCYGRFRDYASWRDGIEDWYRLIDVEYLKGRGHRTVADIIPVYAPSFENDVQGYINSVNRLIDEWRTSGVQ
jgi:hypothetical protein